MGLILSNIGPVMPTLMERTDSTVVAMGYIVAARSLGYLIGCGAAGCCYDKYDKWGHWLLSGGLFWSGFFNGVIPFIYNAVLLVFVFLVQGIAVGFLDTGGHTPKYAFTH